MTDEPGVYPCDEPMATIQRTFDEDTGLPDWDELSPTEKQSVLETSLKDNTLAELIEARKRLQQVFRHHDTSEAYDELLCPTIESVCCLIRMRIQKEAEASTSTEESFV